VFIKIESVKPWFYSVYEPCIESRISLGREASLHLMGFLSLIEEAMNCVYRFPC